jgi:uncharacterized LabA/DUF88 family protein
MNDRETIVFIDGGYLAKITSRLGKEGKHLKCHINQLAMHLAKERNLWVNEVYYYTAPPYQSPIPTIKEKKKKQDYDNFTQVIKRVKPSISLREGRCQKDDKGDFHQKGVDTYLTMDLMRVAQRREVKNIIVLACDTDFVPIMNQIREDYGIHIILAYYFEKQRNGIFSMSNHILTACDDKILIEKKHFDLSAVFTPLDVDKTLRRLTFGRDKKQKHKR